MRLESLVCRLEGVEAESSVCLVKEMPPRTRRRKESCSLHNVRSSARLPPFCSDGTDDSSARSYGRLGVKRVDPTGAGGSA